jgi:hypothetical protein
VQTNWRSRIRYTPSSIATAWGPGQNGRTRACVASLTKDHVFMTCFLPKAAVLWLAKRVRQELEGRLNVKYDTKGRPYRRRCASKGKRRLSSVLRDGKWKRRINFPSCVSFIVSPKSKGGGKLYRRGGSLNSGVTLAPTGNNIIFVRYTAAFKA